MLSQSTTNNNNNNNNNRLPHPRRRPLNPTNAPHPTTPLQNGEGGEDGGVASMPSMGGTFIQRQATISNLGEAKNIFGGRKSLGKGMLSGGGDGRTSFKNAGGMAGTAVQVAKRPGSPGGSQDGPARSSTARPGSPARGGTTGANRKAGFKNS